MMGFTLPILILFASVAPAAGLKQLRQAEGWQLRTINVSRLAGTLNLLSPEHDTKQHQSMFAKMSLNNVESELCGFDKLGMKKVWRDYATAHQEARAEIKAGGNPKILVWHCAPGEQCGGNGDQIKGLATAFYLAMATNRTFFVSTWEHSGFKVLDLFQPRFVNWVLPNMTCGSEEHIDWHYGKQWQPVKEAAKFSKQCVYLRSSSAPNDLVPGEGLPGMRTTLKQVFDVAMYRRGCVFNFLFTGAPLLFDLLRQRMPFHFESPYSALHLRFGDASMGNIAAAGFDMRMPEDSSVVFKAMDCVESMKKKAAPGRTLPVLVLTDSMAMKKIVLDARLMAGHVGKGVAVGTTHEERGGIAAPKSSGYGEAAAVDVQDAWVDQMALAGSSYFVRTKSGFSESAAEIGLIRPERVYEYKHREYCKSVPFFAK